MSCITKLINLNNNYHKALFLQKKKENKRRKDGREGGREEEGWEKEKERKKDSNYINKYCLEAQLNNQIEKYRLSDVMMED